MRTINVASCLAILLMFVVLRAVNAAPMISDLEKNPNLLAGSPTQQVYTAKATDGGLSKGELLFSPASLSGPGGNRIGIQAFAMDERSKSIYTLQLNGAKSGNQSTINRLPIEGPIKRGSVGYSRPVSYYVGHQGLGIEYLSDGDFRLWTTAYTDPKQAVRYSYSDGHPLENIELYGLFGKDFRNRSSSTPTISHDQQYLIAIGLRKRASSVTVRVWRLADMIKRGPGDYSKSWLYEWDTLGLTDSTHPTQGIASDGETIWMVAGNNDIHVPKRLQGYTLHGSLLFSDGNLKVGRAQAILDGSGSIYEPEGLALFYNGGRLILCLGILSGDLGARHTRIYEIKDYRQ